MADGIYMTNMKEQLTADSTSKLTNPNRSFDEMIFKLKSPDISVNRITVTGHADRMNIAGVPGYNIKLAQDRTEAAKSYLINEGIDAKLISVESKSDREHAETCDAKFKSLQQLQHCLAANRRVEVIVEAMGQK
ncbi:MAG: OmpA family protein [Burkholderiales bacterium]